ncbi:alpha/beta fold hydrolase [Arthrobacter sp. SDTb3-6]|uniref:alpha/beta fold hydrolase n=1 Tax=Arthrobacter sp. SDTb3-6 TaxID=2713571 RepID=UPI00159DD3CC|nr:alpha/beta fold hydrolase [Arthrobacter sp. SDTb3-6]NVM99892.1 alpha/beta fold hydrolase [Arthrobacter sp. SDTb3-6]
MESTDCTTLSQTSFDALGPEVRTLQTASGRTVNYIDEGEPEWQPLVFLGGAGTTVRAFRLLEFARTLREELGVRIISVERNGLGGTAFDPAVGHEEYADDVWSVLDSLAVENVSVVAISGGGPYAAWLAAARPDRVRSLHLACAYSDKLAGAQVTFNVGQIAANPVTWWTFPPESSVHRIPGFADSVIEEAVRGMFARGRDTPPDGLQHAFDLYQEVVLPDLSTMPTPSFLYWGADDALVPQAHMDRWRSWLPNVACERVYEGEGHDVQYRHWDQILVDVSFLGEREIVSAHGETLLATPQRAAELRAAGAMAGMAAWSTD